MDAEKLKKIFLFCVEKAARFNTPENFIFNPEDSTTISTFGFDFDISNEVDRDEEIFMLRLSRYITTINIDASKVIKEKV